LSLRTPKRLKSFQTPSHARAPKQEEGIAIRVKGKRVPGSGSGQTKGDVRLKRVCRIETKTTKANSFTVSREMVKKIEDAALSTGEIPVIVIEFNDEGKPVDEVCVVPMYVLDMIAGGNDGATG